MAEPVNTPMPPGTPISATPRSTSPAPPPPPLPAIFPPILPRSSSAPKPVVLHIGDPIKYNANTYSAFSALYTVIRPSTSERQRPEFIRALKDRRWGDFAAIFRPFWSTGGEMGAWDDELIALLPPSVKVFASAGAGFDWADTKLLAERGIVYCNGGLAAAEAVADFAVALIISTFRVLPYCITAAASGEEKRFQECHDTATARSRNLRSQKLGLVGLGNIGQQIARKMDLAFGMEVLYYDVVRRTPEVEQQLNVRFCKSLEELCRASDCLVLCTPSSGGTLINEQSLKWFKLGSRFVNIARGSLVDEEALADALEQGRLSSVALDVHADEPRVHERLRALAGDRALLTCHNAGGTVETHVGFEELAMRNIIAVLSGKQPITPVNLQWLRSDS
ncbi:putative D-isomer specific 2-hydroxyacid dehydrogenase [Seiridium cardinale]|uniref:D-isomer specific 2-hydroxyacid dehydrogenase n=1 Tax=Seiridium cardinale TaxID=138064 RepID=A0ABR2Y311_9PEZI